MLDCDLSSQSMRATKEKEPVRSFTAYRIDLVVEGMILIPKLETFWKTTEVTLGR